MSEIELNLETPPGEPLAEILNVWFEGVLEELARPEVSRLAQF